MTYLFWSILCFLTISWFIMVMLIVAYRGGIDIKHLLKDLQSDGTYENEDIPSY
ncbi:MAG: hypothetical protein J0H29_16985 [Sphingobacteriales bacterium]|nr:hypothetical protein [Sphingobacteriales bacterium]